MALDSETTLTLPETARMAQAAVEPALHGSVLVLIQFDVCEEIRLDQLRELFGEDAFYDTLGNVLTDYRQKAEVAGK